MESARGKTQFKLRQAVAEEMENTNRLNHKPQHIKSQPTQPLQTSTRFIIIALFIKVSHESKIIANNNIYDLFISISIAFSSGFQKLLESHCFRYRVKIVFKNEMKFLGESKKSKLFWVHKKLARHQNWKKNIRFPTVMRERERKKNNFCTKWNKKSNPSLNKS